MRYCQIGIDLLIKEKTKDKAWFNYDEDNNFIHILESPAKRITEYNIGAVAKSVANSFNKALNKEYEVGNVFYPIKDNSKVGVKIRPSAKQLEILNAKDAEEAEKIRQEAINDHPELFFKEETEIEPEDEEKAEQLRIEQEEKDFNQPLDLKSEIEKLPQPFKKVESKFTEKPKQKELFKNLSENRQKVVNKMFDILKQLGVSLEETEQIFNKQKEINSLKDKLSTNLDNIQKLEIQEQIKNLEKEGYNEDVLVMADTLNGVLQFVKGQLTDDNFTEDVVHFVVDVLEQKNPELYQKFKNEITKYKIYQETLESYKKLPQYRKENGAVNFDKIKKEAIAKVLSSYLLGEPVENDVTNFTNLWQTSKIFIKSLFNKLSKSNVNQFQEFSKKLLNDYIEENDKNFKLSGEEFYSVKSSKNIQKRLSFTQYFFGKPSSTSLAPNKSPSEIRNYFESFRDKISKVEETNEEGEKEEFYELNGNKAVRATSIASYKKAYENVNPSEVAKLKREASLGAGNLVHDLFHKIGKRYINETTGELRDVSLERPENSEYYLIENTDKLPTKTLDITDKDVSDVIYKGKQKVYSKSDIGLNSIIERNGVKFKVSLTEFNGEFYEYYILPIDLYDVLEYHLSNILNSYPKGTLFSQELPVINEEAGYAGTLDFIAFLPNGKMDILDWKSTDMYYTNTSGERVKRENVSPFNEIYWKNQLGLYKNAIYSHMPYFVKDKVGLFERSMAIPIGLDIKMRLIDPKKGYVEGNKEYKIEKIKIVDITDIFTVPDDDFAFIPVATDEQTTGIEELDKAIEKLWALHERIKNFPLKEGESYAKKNIELQNIRDAIKELQIKHSATKFLNAFNKSYLRFDNLKNKDISYLENAVKNNTELSEQENEDLGEFMSDLYQGIEFLKSMQEFPTILSQLKIDKTSSEYEKRLVEYTASLSTSSKILIEDLSNLQLKIVDLIAKQEGMQNYLELDIQQSKLQKWINNTRSWMSREEKSVALAGKIYNTAAYLAKKDVSDYFSNEGKFKTVKENLDKWVKDNKTTLKEAYELLTERDSKNGNLISLANDISKDWYELFNKKRDEFQDYYNALAVEAEKKQLKGSKARDYIEDKYKAYVESFFNENYDIAEYLKELQEKFTKESERIKKLEFSTDSVKNAEEITKHLLRWRENNNVFRNPKALFNDYNSIKKHFKKEKWYSEKYKTIVKNKALLDTYELFREINIEAVKLGMLDDVSTKGKFLAKVLLPDSFISLLKHIVLRQFYKVANYINYKFDPYGQKVQSVYIDPLSGKPLRKIAVKYKYTPENDESQLSEDLFSMFTLWKSHIIKYKHLKDIENKLLTVQMVESLKRVEEIIPGDKKIKTQSNTVIDNSKLKLQAKKSEANEVLDTYLEKYLYSTGTDRDNLQRIFEFFRDWAQSVHIGLKPSSWISNYLGADFNAKLLNNKWMTAEDYDYANMIQSGVLIPDKTSPEISKKALFLIKHLNTRIHSELDNPALKGLIENTQSKITNVAYFGYKYGEHIIQDNIAIAHFLNATIKNGQIVNISDYVKSKYPNITDLSEKERVKTFKKINEEIKNIKENDNLFNYVKKNGDKYILEGLSKKEEIKFYNTIKNKVESAIGGIDPDNSSSLKLSFVASLIMMYKQWIPRLLLARLENFRKDAQTGEYTYGRSNAFSNVLFSQYFLNILPSFLKTLGKTSLRGIPFYYKSDTIKSLTETTPYQSQWLVEAGKKKYLEKYQEFSKNGRQLDITQDQFVELFSNSFNSQLREFSVLTVFTAIVMLISAGADGDDEDDLILDPIASALGIRSFAENNKNIMRLMSRVLFKTNRDLWFAFSPQQALEIFQDVSPLLPFIAQLIELQATYLNEIYSRSLEDEAEENKVKSLHKTIKVIPYASEVDFVFLNMSEDYREFLGEKEPTQMEF